MDDLTEKLVTMFFSCDSWSEVVDKIASSRPAFYGPTCLSKGLNRECMALLVIDLC